MQKRFHSIDLHKKYATINVWNSDGKEIKFFANCQEFQQYINGLDEDDLLNLFTTLLTPLIS